MRQALLQEQQEQKGRLIQSTWGVASSDKSKGDPSRAAVLSSLSPSLRQLLSEFDHGKLLVSS
jgi:hypothetical protein